VNTWGDDMETHDSVDAFVRSREGLTAKQLKALGVYSQRQTERDVERRLEVPGYRKVAEAPGMAAYVRKPSRWRRIVRWLANGNVWLFVGLFVALLLAVNAVAR
jgi:hypothetical protein